MQTLSATAERLRVVKKAQAHFLSLWALDCLLKRQEPIEKFKADMDSALKDPKGHNWSLMYRGSVLDD
jgi:hypothetical protein